MIIKIRFHVTLDRAADKTAVRDPAEAAAKTASDAIYALLTCRRGSPAYTDMFFKELPKEGISVRSTSQRAPVPSGPYPESFLF